MSNHHQTHVGIGAIGGLAYYGYTHPIDKEDYRSGMGEATPLELETLTPAQIAAHTFLLNRTMSRATGWLMRRQV